MFSRSLLSLLAAVCLLPDEGQWLPTQIREMDWAALQKRGMQLGKDEFMVAYGREVRVPGTMAVLGFEQVTQESRCPSDVVCVWEGEVTLSVGITVGDGPTVPHEVTLRGGASAPLTVQGITVTLFRVDPYPAESQPRELEDYVAFFRVGANGRASN